VLLAPCQRHSHDPPCSLPFGTLALSAPSARARLAAAIYAVSVAALFASSALYHRVRWRSPAARRWMPRLDHPMIFVVIAGTCTPFALIALRGALAGALLIAVWAGAAAGGLLYTAAPLSMPASARTPSGPSSATTRSSTPW
jgi:hemolysin III